MSECPKCGSNAFTGFEDKDEDVFNCCFKCSYFVLGKSNSNESDNERPKVI
jgi:hypothetical protein